MKTFKLLFIILVTFSINLSALAQKPDCSDKTKTDVEKEKNSKEAISLNDIEQLKKEGVDKSIIEAKYNQMIEAMEYEFHYPNTQKPNVKQIKSLEDGQITLSLKMSLKNKL